MMRPKISIAICLFLAACEFAPHGEFKKDVDPNYPIPDVTIDFINAPDTVVMYNATTFTYKITGVDESENHFIEVTTLLKGDNAPQAINTDGTLEGSFTINGFPATGYYYLTMKVYQQTGSGDLADQLGSEYLVFQKTIVISFDGNAAHQYKITFVRENGRLKLSWQKGTKPNFTSYLLMRTLPDTAFLNSTVKYFKFTDLNTTSMYDSAFVGGTISYALAVQTVEDQTIDPFSNSSTYTENTSPIVKFEKDLTGKVKAYWTKSPYYANFLQYKFNDFSNSLSITEPELADTTTLFVAAFGNAQLLRVKSYSEESSYTSVTNYLYSDPKPFRFEAMVHAPAANRSFMISGGYAIAYDISTNKKVDSIAVGNYGQIAVSPSGNIVWVFHDNIFYKIDPVTLTTLSTIDATALIDYNQGAGLHAFAVSDQNTFVAMSNYTLTAYDAGTGVLLGHLTQYPESYSGLSFSADGNYFKSYESGTLFKISGGTLTKVMQAGILSFDVIDPSTFLQYNFNSKKIESRDIATQGLISSYSLPVAYDGFQNLIIDPVKHYVAVFKNSRIFVYDFVGGVEKFDAPNNSFYEIQLYEGILYSGGGPHLKLN